MEGSVKVPDPHTIRTDLDTIKDPNVDDKCLFGHTGI